MSSPPAAECVHDASVGPGQPGLWEQCTVEHRALLRSPAPPHVSDVEVLTNAYPGMLRDLRGRAPTTVHQHVTTARAFLDALVYETTPARLSAATATDIERFVRDAGARLSRASLQPPSRTFGAFAATWSHAAGSAPAWMSRSIRPVSTDLNSCHAASLGPRCRHSCGPSTDPRGAARLHDVLSDRDLRPARE
jgi:hypothetical protein